uniref:Uncharacterized protein n=1 Tax=Ditylenchus dipsaci TaxID=166011 RepID=A0A915DJX0_9BILA
MIQPLHQCSKCPLCHRSTTKTRNRNDQCPDKALVELGKRHSVMGVLNTHRKSHDDTARGGQPGGVASMISADIISMKRRRQCSLEWEFIATILDRVFLILFTLTVLTVTAGMMVTGRVAQLHYEQLAKELIFFAN